MLAKLSPCACRSLMDEIISQRCNNLLPSDIIGKGSFSRPQTAVWSPEQIVREICSHDEGPLAGQILDNHKFQKQVILKSSSDSPDPSLPASVQIQLPDHVLTALEQEKKRILTITPGYPPKIFASCNRMKCRRRPTVSGFCQARVKLSCQVCRDICQAFIDQIFNSETLKDLDTLVFAIDGSTIPVTVNFDEPDNIVCTAGRPRAGLHLNAACCLNAGNILASLIIQNEGKKNEHSAAFDMIKALKNKFPDKRLVFIMDRLYFSYKLASFCQENDIELIIRLQKKVFSRLSGGAAADQPLDQSYHISCSSRQDRKIQAQSDRYRYVPKKTLKAIREELEIPEGTDIDLDFRIISMPMPQEVREVLKNSSTTNSDDSSGFTYLYTTLSSDEMAAESIVSWYFWRWQIEVSYGNLKFKTGLNALHSCKENNILQEIWMSVMKYNAACAVINYQTEKLAGKKRRHRKKGKRSPRKNPMKQSMKTQRVCTQKADAGYEVKISFSETARNLRKFLCGQITEQEFEDELDLQLVYTLPGRHTPRGTTTTRVHGFQWSFH